MKIQKLVGCGILIAILLASAPGNCMDPDDPKLKELAVSAVINKYKWVSKCSPIVTLPLPEKQFFKETLLYYVPLTSGPEPGPTFIVAISKDGSTRVFSDYTYLKGTDEIYGGSAVESSRDEYFRKQAKAFSEIYLKENISLKDSDLKKYIDIFLDLLSSNMDVISSINKCECCPKYIIELTAPYQDIVKPIVYTLKDGIYELVFFSLDFRRGVLMKWKLDVTTRGEVVDYKSEVLAEGSPVAD